jgi:branched-chain amino acid transport system permease protein
METLAFALFNGISYGLLLFLLSSGFTLIFGIMGVLNIAHASFFMVGAYLAYEISRRTGFWAGLVVAPVLVAVLGALVERCILRQVRTAGHMAELLVTFGLSYVVAEAVQLIWGRTPVPYFVPGFLDFPLFSLGGIQYSAYRIFSFVLTLGVFVALFLLFRLSIVGLVIQASLSHPKMAAALGHNVQRAFNLLFALGAGLAGLGGALAGNVLGTQPTMALQLGALIFVVVVVGGLGSLAGAFITSLLIGVIQNVAVSYPVSLIDIANWLHLDADAIRRSSDLRTLSSASIAPLLPYLLMVLVLLTRPRGLFGKRDV